MCFWLKQAVKLNNDTVHVKAEILRYSLGKYGLRDNEDKQEFNTVIIGKSTIPKMHSSLMCVYVFTQRHVFAYLNDDE